MGKLIVFVIVVGSWIVGIVFGIYSFIVLGILQIVNGATAIPVNGSMIGWGIAWVLVLSSLISSIIIWGGTAIGAVIAGLKRI